MTDDERNPCECRVCGESFSMNTHYDMEDDSLCHCCAHTEVARLIAEQGKLKEQHSDMAHALSQSISFPNLLPRGRKIG